MLTSRARNCYAAFQVLDILSEARRNVVTGTTLMTQGVFDVAAKNFEMAAEKLRVVQREYDASVEELERASRHNDKVSYHADNAGGAHGKDSNDK